jgi:DNA-binding transcriptional LysR family regulator
VTELGQKVYEASTRMLDNAREVQALAGTYGSGPHGVLRVSVPIVFGQTWIAPRLPGFLDAFPQVDVRLTLVDRQIDLVEDGVDLAIRISSSLAPGLAARPLATFPYILVASPAYLEKHAAPVLPADLSVHACCYLGYGRFGARWDMSRGSERASVDVAARVTLNNSGAIVAFAAAGGGIGLVPHFAAAEALAQGQVVRVLADWTLEEPYVAAVNFVYTPGRHIALKIRAFIDYFAAPALLEQPRVKPSP